MDLSIVIVTRDTRALTCAAIRSVTEDPYALTKEVIVVDNGSSDGTAAAVADEFPNVHYLRSERNLGFARACNWAASQARGEFLLLLNTDARVIPPGLTVAVQWMRANPDCAVAGAQLLNDDGSRQNSIASFPCLATELLNKSLLRRFFPRRFPGKEHTFTAPVAVDSVVGAFFLTRRKIWAELGGLDERFFFFLEETDYCLRARAGGRRVSHLPQVRVWHGQGKSASRHAAAARIEYWRSRYLYFRKHRSRSVLWVLTAGLLLRLGADAASSLALATLTFGRSGRWTQKWAVHRALLAWHCRGCPRNVGLPR